MAEADPQRQMSLVPYSQSASQQIVLRHENAVVVFDQESRELSLQSNPQHAMGSNECPFCHRPLSDNANAQQFSPGEPSPSSPHDDNDRYVNPEYFRLLANSIPSSAASSTPHTPLRQLPGLRSARLRDVSGSVPLSGPPTGAEFVGSTPSPTPTHQTIQDDSFSPDYFKKFFTEKRELGRGGNGVVLLVEHVLNGFCLGEFACKRIAVGNDRSWLGKALIEVKLLQQLKHQNLVSYHHVWLEDTQISIGPSVPCIFILQQYCNAGDLHNYVLGSTKTATTKEALKERMRRRSKGLAERPTDIGAPRSMNFDEIFSFFRDITSGLNHLHTQGYIHRDLKPSNCLLHDDGHGITVHVSDFGEVQSAGEKRTSTGATGTISYCAPEVLQRESGSPNYHEFTTKSDIFSLGMIIYFMCFGRLPYQNASILEDEAEDLDQLRAEVTAWQGFNDSRKTRSDLPEKLYRFLKRLLSPNPAERPSTEQILQAIKAGGEFSTTGNQSPDVNSMSSRISSVESPRPPTMQRKPSNPKRVNRQSSQLSRSHSSELIHSPRNSPTGLFRNNDQTPTPDSAIAVRSQFPPPPPQAVSSDSTPDPLTDPTMKQMPRLMLPPPSSPQSFQQRLRSLYHLSHDDPIILVIKFIFFALKLFTLTHPCAPLATKQWLMYPLMALSLSDFLELRGGLHTSGLLLMLHLGVLAMVKRWWGVCEFVEHARDW